MSCGPFSPLCFAGLSSEFFSCKILNTLSLARISSASVDSSQGVQHGAGSDPCGEDHVDDFKSQQAPNLAFSSLFQYGLFGSNRLILLPCENCLFSPPIIDVRLIQDEQFLSGQHSTNFSLGSSAIIREKMLFLNSNTGLLIQRAFETRDTKQTRSVWFDRR